MLDILTISSKLFKGVLQKMAVRAIKNSLGVDVNLDLENLTVRHADGENIEFGVTINGSMTETEFKKLIEKALK
jgi:hypothetical protein